MKKSIAAAAICLIMLLSLTACGNNASASVETSEKSGTEISVQSESSDCCEESSKKDCCEDTEESEDTKEESVADCCGN